jgi:myo-inositol 2-dehydrogenase/D-chiro-inositol 1-dehydrogenase
MDRPIVQVGIIGTGTIGSWHARNLAHQAPDAEVVALMDIDRERVEDVAAACGEAQVYADAAALIADEDVEALLIATPDATHAELTIACINAGKPVLCEKPLATSLADAERVLHTEVAAGRRLVQVGFMREYDPAHRELKALLDRGDIGQALAFRGVHVNLADGYDRTVEAVIVNSAIHDIHSARWMMGEEIASVHVQWVAAHPERLGTCRLLVVQMTFQSHALGTIEWNGNSGYGYEVHVEVTGELGSARTAPRSSPTVRQSGAASQAIDQHWSKRFNSAYLDEVQAWTRSVLAQEPTGPSAWDGYMSLVVADACIRSAKTGRPQEIPVDHRPVLY